MKAWVPIDVAFVLPIFHDPIEQSSFRLVTFVPGCRFIST